MCKYDMKLNFFLFLISGIIFSIGSLISSQDTIDTSEDVSDLRKKMIVYELQDYKYKFFKGDTIRYRVASFDSIIINYDKPLEKTRFELVEITCDSTTKDNRFLLKIKLKQYIADESYGKVQNIRRTTTPWLDRWTMIWIDSLGNRLQTIADDNNLLAMSPGGAFAPHLFFPFRERYRYINELWLENSHDTLCENGIPCSIVKQFSQFRGAEPIDTLGYECVRFNYIKTANGLVDVITEDSFLRTDATIAGSGVMTISKNDGIPIHYFANVEQKLAIFNNSDESIPGLHLISTDWTIDSFIPSPKRIEFDKKQNQKK